MLDELFMAIKGKWGKGMAIAIVGSFYMLIGLILGMLLGEIARLL